MTSKALMLSVLLAVAPTVPATAQTASLRVMTLAGESFDLAQHRGKWVIVNWWATWCVPCIMELPEISAFVAQREAHVAAIGLAFEDSETADIVAFLETRPVAFPVAHVNPGVPRDDLRFPRGLPTTQVIAPDGSVAREFVGPVTARELAAVIDPKR
jgi:thiol-disulfide isomerase/thioredoxin